MTYAKDEKCCECGEPDFEQYKKDVEKAIPKYIEEEKRRRTNTARIASGRYLD